MKLCQLVNRRLTDQLRGIRQYDVIFADPAMLLVPGPSHCNVCVVEPEVAGEPQQPFAGQILVVFVQLLDQDEGTSLTQAVGHLICFHGPRWLENEGYALDGGKRTVRYFECYADVWIDTNSAAVRWRPFTPSTRELAAFETQIGCSLPDYHEATDERVC